MAKSKTGFILIREQDGSEVIDGYFQTLAEAKEMTVAGDQIFEVSALHRVSAATNLKKVDISDLF